MLLAPRASGAAPSAPTGPSSAPRLNQRGVSVGRSLRNGASATSASRVRRGRGGGSTLAGGRLRWYIHQAIPTHGLRGRRRNGQPPRYIRKDRPLRGPDFLLTPPASAPTAYRTRDRSEYPLLATQNSSDRRIGITHRGNIGTATGTATTPADEVIGVGGHVEVEVVGGPASRIGSTWCLLRRRMGSILGVSRHTFRRRISEGICILRHIPVGLTAVAARRGSPHRNDYG